MTTITVARGLNKVAIACDSRASFSNGICDNYSDKLFSSCNWICGTSGVTEHLKEIFATERVFDEMEIGCIGDVANFRNILCGHVKKFRDEFTFAQDQKEAMHIANLLLASTNGKAWKLYMVDGLIEEIRSPYEAVGSGMDVALGAMYSKHLAGSMEVDVALEGVMAAACHHNETGYPLKLATPIHGGSGWEVSTSHSEELIKTMRRKYGG